jgi:hypothetical protein
MTFEELKIDVSDYLGWGRDLSRLGAEETSIVEACVKHGYEQFLRPTCKEHRGYRWNFLAPRVNLTLTKDTTDYVLGLDNGTITGDIFFDSPGIAPITTGISEHLMRQRSSHAIYGPPTRGVEITVREFSDGVASITKHLLVHPIPDKDYDVHYQMYLYTEGLAESSDVVLGGAYYADVIRSSCRAVAERDYDDDLKIHAKTFEAKLLDAIRRDMKERPKILGSAHDRRVYGIHRTTNKTNYSDKSYESMDVQGNIIE